MDLSTRRRAQQMDNKQSGVPAQRYAKPSASPSRPIHTNKQPTANHRRRHPNQPQSSPSTATEGANGPKKASKASKRLYLDSDYVPSYVNDMDWSYDSEDSMGYPASPGNIGEISESPVEKEQSSAPAPVLLRSGGAGPKKAVRSANHLLNFSFPARERPTASSYRRPQLTHAPYRRERFVQANFRFIVSKAGEYSDNITDPDAVIDWELVEFVRCGQETSDSSKTCSICLEAPRCPRIAKCGHIFCWPCILQLFSYHEHSALASCPVCLREKIRVVDLRPVMMESLQSPQTGSLMDFTLIQRPKHLNLLYLAGNVPCMDAKSPLPQFCTQNEHSLFNRLTITHQLPELLQSEAKALETAIEEAKSAQELTLYMEVAQQMLKEEMDALDLSKSSSLTSSANSNLLSPLSKPLPKHRLADLIPERLEASHCFFFFQSSDAQQIFLHPLNIQYLLKEYPEESMFPKELHQVKVIDLEAKSLDEKMRRKYHAISHLPTACQFSFALIDMTGILKDPLNLADFAEEVKKRADAIQRVNERDARRAAVMAEQLAAKKTADLIALVSQGTKQGSALSGPEIVPPDLDEYFPEIAPHAPSSASPAPHTSSSPSHESNLHASNRSSPSAWDNGRLRASLNKAPEDDFPALPAAPVLPSPAGKPDHVILSEAYISAMPQAATPPSLNFSAAVTATSPAPAKGSTKKKPGKKTILVI